MALWERLLGNLVLTDDLVLNTVFAGFGIGISLGITIRAGASTGGMDIPRWCSTSGSTCRCPAP